MITITFYGLDQFVVGNLSKDLTPRIAKLYGVDEEDIIFISPQVMVFHKGVEQTSWNILIKVSAPRDVVGLQDEMSDLIMKGIGEVAIHVTVLFEYYSTGDRYQRINDDYPLFITEANLVDLENDYDDEEDSESDEEEEDIYTGDIFEGLNK